MPRCAALTIFVLCLVGCAADPAPAPAGPGAPLGQGGWQSEVALEVKAGLNGCAIGDVDPLRPGNEVVAVSADGAIHLAWREAGAWRSEQIVKTPGELIQVAVGDLLPDQPGLEIVAVGNAAGREDEAAPGVAVLVRRQGPRWTTETIHREERLLHGVCVVRGAVYLAGYDEQAHRVRKTKSGWSAATTRLPAPGRSIAALADGGVVVACKNGALVRLGADAKSHLLDQRDVGRARVGASGVHVIAADDGGGLTVLRGAPDPALRNVDRQALIHRSADKLRGAVLADLDPERPGLEAATAGYTGSVVVLYPEGEGWRPRVVANDADRFHHLAAGTLPGYPGYSLVAASLSGRLYVVHRGGPAGLEHSARRAVRLQRISAAVPWPRGVVFAQGKLLTLARGRHRRDGGPTPSIDDRAGTVFELDTQVWEPVVPGAPAGARVAKNARVFAEPRGPFRRWNKTLPKPTDDTRADRPYCTLAWDARTRNIFICGFSGIDRPGKAKFRKNATDSVLRYDLRAQRWFVVEQHDPAGVPIGEGKVVSNAHYPHHDPAQSAPPHGWLNGPDGAEAVGRYLYVVAKDNSVLAQYDLAPIARDPAAKPPPSRIVLGRQVALRGGGALKLAGHSALAVWGGHLYVAFRTTSQVIRLPLREDGDLVRPLRAELIARLDPYDPQTGRSPDITDIAFDRRGALYISAQRPGCVFYAGRPDPAQVFDARGGKRAPLIDLPRLTGRKVARQCNLTFDAQGRIYMCAGIDDTPGDRIVGVIYRAVVAE